ncbi:succinate dehydrogenase cytochrome b560 subunit [Mycena floridula]|nr:succinate dehydrogenase cytochrome b560 subunit [Mycena floridula]
MIPSRLGLGSSLRRTIIVRNNAVARNVLVKRFVQTESMTPAASIEILNKQRLKRPSSPHFTIYQPQLTWLGSIANRVTGVGLSVLLYGFALGYLFVPGTFDSATIIAAATALPLTVKYAAKTILAAPFAFHSLNGIRHLAWDLGKFMTVKGAYTSGYIVLGATAVATGALVMM